MPEFNLRNYNTADTIAAVATPAAKAALGVIKISGRKSLDILSEIFLPKKEKNIKKQKSFTLHYGWVVENLPAAVKGRKKNDRPKAIDEVLAALMRAPRSYTGEDVVEISAHGGIGVLNQILQLVLKKGARLAKPGEFTYRALLNGRIDLLQAESILGLVEARTSQAVSFSCRQLQGENSQKMADLKRSLKELFAASESEINFPEEETGFNRKTILKEISRLEKETRKLKEGQEKANLLSGGLKCVICGRANSGKSTLFNRLLGKERVIVSRVPGTTRDVVEEAVNIKGVPVKIYDTAGILEPKDFLTKKAVAKTKQAFETADLVILLFDGSRKLNRDDDFFLKKTENKNTLLVINKADLPQKAVFNGNFKKPARTVRISALKDSRLTEFEKKAFEAIYSGGREEEANPVFLNQYQKKELENIAVKLNEIKAYLQQGYSTDFINFALKDCLDSAGKITGEVYSEEILESIFNNFCIGK